VCDPETSQENEAMTSSGVAAPQGGGVEASFGTESFPSKKKYFFTLFQKLDDGQIQNRELFQTINKLVNV
jgi:hypothetical protein